MNFPYVWRMPMTVNWIEDTARIVRLLNAGESAADEIDELRGDAKRSRLSVSHRPSSIDNEHTACGIRINPIPLDVNLCLGPGETCTRCTHVIAQCDKERAAHEQTKRELETMRARLKSAEDALRKYVDHGATDMAARLVGPGERHFACYGGGK